MTTLELLPDELLVETVEYLTIFDLYRCFTGLNHRFDAILRSVQLRIVIPDVQTYGLLEIYLRQYAENVNRFDVKYSRNGVNIRSFPNLRSLHLSDATHEQLQQITPTNLPCLNRLTVVVCPTDDQHFTDVLFGQCQFSNLTKCWFPTIVFQDSNIDRLHSCNTLRYFRLNFCHMNTFSKLLSLIPNLISFESSFITSELSVDIDQSHSSLQNLKIHLRTRMTLNNLNSILALIPCLKRLQLRMNVSKFDHDKFTFLRLATILQRRVPQLTRFAIELQVSSVDIKNDLDNGHKMSSLFAGSHMKQCLTKVIETM